MAKPELPTVPYGTIQRVATWESTFANQVITLPFRLKVDDVLYLKAVTHSPVAGSGYLDLYDFNYNDQNLRPVVGGISRAYKITTVHPTNDPRIGYGGNCRVWFAVYRGLASWDTPEGYEWPGVDMAWTGTPLVLQGTHPASTWTPAEDVVVIEAISAGFRPSSTGTIAYSIGPFTNADAATTKIFHSEYPNAPHGSGFPDPFHTSIDVWERWPTATTAPAVRYYSNPSSWTAGDSTWAYNWGSSQTIVRTVLRTSLRSTVARPALAPLKSLGGIHPLRTPVKVSMGAIESVGYVPGLTTPLAYRPALQPLESHRHLLPMRSPARPPLTARGARATIPPLATGKALVVRNLNAIRAVAYVPRLTTGPPAMPPAPPVSLDDGWHYYTTMTPAVPATNQTVGLAGAVTAAAAGTVMDTRSGVVYPRLGTTLRIRPDVAVVERVVEGATKRQWQDELNETGSASMVIPNEHPDATTINEGNVIVFTDEGWTVFGWIIKEMERVQVANGEEIDEVTTFSGVGLLGVLEEAVVYPPRGVGRSPYTDDRYFSWFSPDFEAQWFWPQAKNLGSWRDMTGDSRWADLQGNPLPDEWPDPDAQWIWSTHGTRETAPVGDCYFAGEFTVPAGVDMIELFVAVDNKAIIYFDGQEMGTAQWDGEDTVAWEKTIEVTPGEHYIAVKATNITHAQARADAGEEVREPGVSEPTNPGGLLCTVYETDGLDLFGQPLYRSHDGWRVLAYPSSPPGMTPGMAMWHCIYEALMRGSMEGLRIAFNDETDSDGNPWPVIGDISTKIGTDYLTFFRELCATYVDMWMEPSRFVLHAWVKGMRGAHRDDIELHPVTDPTDPYSGNLAGLTYRIVT